MQHTCEVIIKITLVLSDILSLMLLVRERIPCRTNILLSGIRPQVMDSFHDGLLWINIKVGIMVGICG